MHAWQVAEQGPAEARPLQAVEIPEPEPAAGRGPGQDPGLRGLPYRPAHHRGRSAPAPPPGRPRATRSSASSTSSEPAPTGSTIGERIGIAWLRHTDGDCRFCLRHQENLCLRPAFTGWDADGGFAEAAVVNEAYAYRIPEVFSDQLAAPLLCAGIIGFRALRRAAATGRRTARNLGVRRVRPSRRPGRHRRRRRGPRAYPRAQPPASSPASSARPVSATASIRRGPAGRRYPFRAGGRPGAGSPEHARPRSHACHRRDLPVGHPAARTTSSTSSRNAPSSASLPTPARTARISYGSPPRSRCTSPRRRIRAARPRKPCADLAADRVEGAAVLLPD